MHRATRPTVGLLIALGFGATLLACDEGPRATHADCVAIVDRIVDIELHEQGFRDPALAIRRRREMRKRLELDIRRCVGRRLPKGAMRCVKQARGVEDLSHHCLRPGAQR